MAKTPFHVLLIKRHRISPLPWGDADTVAAREREEHAEPFTRHLRRIGAWSLLLLGAALLLAGLQPTGLGPNGVPGILTFGLLAIPFLDRSRERDPRRRRVWIALGAIVLLAWLGLTIYGAVTVPVSHTEMGG